MFIWTLVSRARPQGARLRFLKEQGEVQRIIHLSGRSISPDKPLGPLTLRQMKNGLLLFCLLFACSLFAQSGNPPARVSKRWLESQDSTTQRQVQDGRFAVSRDMNKGFGLHLMPFSFINVLPRLRLGVQFKANRFSYLLDVEYGFDNASKLSNDLARRDYRFIGLRPEIRYDISRRNRNIYVGLEVPVTFMERNISGEFSTVEGSFINVDVARQNRFRLSVIGKMGVQYLIGRHFYLDAYTGVGVYFRDVEYSDRVGEQVASDDSFDERGFFGPVQEGQRWLPELALGVRAGWWF
jgi:hypothetical protein